MPWRSAGRTRSDGRKARATTNRRVGVGNGDIGPGGERAPLLPGEVEMRGKHYRCRLDRDLVDPRRIQIPEGHQGNDRSDGLALRRMAGRIRLRGQ